VLRTRVLTAAVALPAVLAVIIFTPDWFFSIFIGVLGAWALYEVAAMTAARGVSAALVIAFAGALPLGGMLAAGDRAGWIAPAVVFALMMLAACAVAVRGGEGGPKGIILVLLGALWVGVMFPYFAILRNIEGGIPAIITMLLLVIATDTGAYFGGQALGRIKLAPRVSPNKTVEGAISGLLASVGGALILRKLLMPEWSVTVAAEMGAAIAILAQLGDLCGSAFKRSAGVKDSGWIFPGHGGLLDRTCSLVFAAAFTYYCFK
jgi:phosphatidate cytidylyltransferase